MRKKKKPEAEKWMVWARITQAHRDRKKEQSKEHCRRKLRRLYNDC